MAAPPSTPNSFFEFAQELLDVADECTALTVGGQISLIPKARVYVSPGDPAFDCCPMLAVSGSSLGEDYAVTTQVGAPSNRGHGAAYQRSNLVGFTIWVLRCTPVPDKNGNPPSVARLDASAQKVLQDAWCIWNGVMQAIRDDLLWGGRCTEIYFDQAVQITPQGGCAGFRIPLRAHLGGIPVATP